MTCRGLKSQHWRVLLGTRARTFFAMTRPVARDRTSVTAPPAPSPRKARSSSWVGSNASGWTTVGGSPPSWLSTAVGGLPSAAPMAAECELFLFDRPIGLDSVVPESEDEVEVDDEPAELGGR